MTNRRGSVIVESAMMLTVILFVLYGAVQTGVVGLEQLTVDSGAFTMAHQQAFNYGANPFTPGKTVALAAVPHLNSPNVSIPAAQVGEPPTTQFNGQYGFTTPNARYGGVSLVQPVQVVATITRNNIQNLVLGVVGSTISVTGTAIEPVYRLINPHGNVSGNAFNSAAAFTTSADPLSESAPPYLVGFTYIQTCSYLLPGNSIPGWATCPTPLDAAIGSAEYLDAHNWSRAVNGVTPSGATGSKVQGAVFWEMRYHQTLFANISAALASVNVGADPTGKANVLDPRGNGFPLPSVPPAAHAAKSQDVQCVYEFDNINTGAYAPGTVGIIDPLFALHPDATGRNPNCVAP